VSRLALLVLALLTGVAIIEARHERYVERWLL
jgi:hypothetical protein